MPQKMSVPVARATSSRRSITLPGDPSNKALRPTTDAILSRLIERKQSNAKCDGEEEVFHRYRRGINGFLKSGNIADCSSVSEMPNNVIWKIEAYR